MSLNLLNRDPSRYREEGYCVSHDQLSDDEI